MQITLNFTATTPKEVEHLAGLLAMVANVQTKLADSAAAPTLASVEAPAVEAAPVEKQKRTRRTKAELAQVAPPVEETEEDEEEEEDEDEDEEEEDEDEDEAEEAPKKKGKAPKVKLEDVRAAFRAYIKATSREKGAKVLKKFKVASVTDLDESQYEAAVAALKV